MNLEVIEIDKVDDETMQVELYFEDGTEFFFPIEFETEQVEEEEPESHNLLLIVLLILDLLK